MDSSTGVDTPSDTHLYNSRLQRDESPLRRRRSTGVRPKPATAAAQCSPSSPSRFQLQRANSTGTKLIPIISNSETPPSLRDIQRERARTLAKLTAPMSSFTSSLPSDSATGSFDDGLTTSSAALADESSLASEITATDSPRLHPFILAKSHEGMVDAALSFLQKELGQTALRRRPAVEPMNNFVLPADQDAHKLWVAVQDGVLLLKLMNLIFPAIAIIDRRDVPSAKRENIAKFIHIAQTKLFLHPNDLFCIDDLINGDPRGFLQVCITILAVAQRIRPTSTPQQSPRRGVSPSTSSNDSEASRSKHPIEQKIFHPNQDLRRAATRKAAISFVGDAEVLRARRSKFYGVDRRMSESAIDLVSIEEEENSQSNKRNGRQSEGVPSGAAPLVEPLLFELTEFPQNKALAPRAPLTSDEALRPPMIPRSVSTLTRYLTGEIISGSGIKPKVRRLSSGSSSQSVPFPSSHDPTGSPTKSKRPVHPRVKSEVQVLRHDSEPGRGRSESLSTSCGSTSDDFKAKRRSQSQVRQQLSFNDGQRVQTYHLGGVIGSGQFGSVHKALDWNKGRVVAVKRIKLAGRSEEEIEQVVHEVNVLKRVAHPCIVKYEGLVRTRAYLNIIMEYVEGSLLDVLRTYGEFSENLSASFVTQILEGLGHLHDREVVHCDLKCANILCTKSGNIKIGDFGVSLNLSTTRLKPVTQEDLLSGTPSWMAPEVIELKGASKASDIWSLGATVLEMITGKPPFAELLSMSAMYHIVEQEIPIPATVTPHLYHFLTLCLVKNPSERPSAQQLSTHEWLSMNHATDYRPQDSIPFFRRRSSADPRCRCESICGGSLPGFDHSGSSIESASLKTNLSPGSPPFHPQRLGSDLSDPSHMAPGDGGSCLPQFALEHTCQTSVNLLAKEAVPLDETPTSSTSDQSSGSTRKHLFVKTSFSRPMDCRSCHQTIKRKSKATLCEGCGLICHQQCGINLAAFPCDLRSALGAYHSPMSSRLLPSSTNLKASRLPFNPTEPLVMSLNPSPVAPEKSEAKSSSPLALRSPFKPRGPERASIDGKGTKEVVRRKHTVKSLSVSHISDHQTAAALPVDERHRKGRLSRSNTTGDCIVS